MIVTLTPPFSGIKTKAGKHVDRAESFAEYHAVAYEDVEMAYDHFGFEKPDMSVYHQHFEDVVNGMRTNDKLGRAVALVRSEPERDRRSFLKMTRLPSIFYGTFEATVPTGRKGYKIEDRGLVAHSGLVCLDMDHVGKYHAWAVKQAKDDPHVHACFRSPSGDGLKVVFKVPPADALAYHREYYSAVMRYWQEKMLSLRVDSACANPSRRCFASFDPELYYNEASYTFTAHDEPAKVVTKVPRVFKQDDVYVMFQRAVYRVEHGLRANGRKVEPLSFVDGSKHFYVIALAGMCKGWDMTWEDFQSAAGHIIADAYERNAAQTIFEKV